MDKKIKEFLEGRKEEFQSNYERLGNSCATMNMRVVNQYAGFISFFEGVDVTDKSILDIGCGLGNLNDYLKLRGMEQYLYLGIDIVESFVKEAAKQYGSKNIEFKVGNFIEDEYKKSFDYIIGNELFYRKIKGMNTLEYVQQVIKKAYELCNEAVMFNFLSDYADIQYEKNFYIKPQQILDFAYQLSKRVILKNDYSPFEFTMIIYKDQDIHVRPTYYKKFGEKNIKLLNAVYPQISSEISTLNNERDQK